MTGWNAAMNGLKLYGLLWMTAVGGILGANLAATVAMLLFAVDIKGEAIRPWAHYGWYGGTAMFFFGAVLGKLRFIQGDSLGEASNAVVDSDGSIDSDGSDDSGESPTDTVVPGEETDPVEQRSSVPGFLFACALAGAFVGMLLGGSLLVFLFSYSYSPFASQAAASSLEVVQDPVSTVPSRRSVIQTHLPLAPYLCLTPALIGVIVGLVGGGMVVWKYGGTKRSS